MQPNQFISDGKGGLMDLLVARKRKRSVMHSVPSLGS